MTMPDTPILGGDGAAPARDGRIDGRRLRSERTRRLIIEAYIALVRETGQMPTAAQIAERAGYSVRSIFERFPDLTALRVAVTDHAIAEARASGALRDLDADRLTRIMSRQLSVMRMEMMFRPELSTVADAVRKKTMLALEALMDFESWARMRELYGLSFEEASAVWVKAIDRLLPPTPA